MARQESRYIAFGLVLMCLASAAAAVTLGIAIWESRSAYGASATWKADETSTDPARVLVVTEVPARSESGLIAGP